MKTRNIVSLLILAGITCSGLILLPGCASKKKLWGDTRKGLILSYRMPESQPLRYISTGDASQKVEVMGQKFDVNMKSYQEYSVQTEHPSANPMTLKITVDTMYIYLKTPMKDFTPDMTGVIGRQFPIRLTSLGKESDFSQAEAITFNLGGETRNLAPEFQSFFPDLPGKPVKPGDSWNYPDTIKEESGGNWLHLYVNCTATLEGYETVNGRECAKVMVPFSGIVLGEGNMNGIATKTSGEVSGTDHYYFDYKNGVLVKISSDGTASTMTKTSGAKEMTIPSTRKFIKEIWLAN